jgi:hypothetical protein
MATKRVILRERAMVSDDNNETMVTRQQQKHNCYEYNGDDNNADNDDKDNKEDGKNNGVGVAASGGW